MRIKVCRECKEFFARYVCAQTRGYDECDCPKCQGYCECPDPDILREDRNERRANNE